MDLRYGCLVLFTATEACQWPPSDPYRASELR